MNDVRLESGDGRRPSSVEVDEMDDAIHIATPWSQPQGQALCGGRDRLNLAAFTDERPDSMAGCWTCLVAAQWIDAAVSLASTTGASGALRDPAPTPGLGAGSVIDSQPSAKEPAPSTEGQT